MQYILGAYSQLPFGSSSEEYEVLLSSQLKPLLTTVYQNPGYKLLFHLSASEYEYYEANHPEINMLICDLCRKGQMEILSSGYYDVVLSLLPAHERSAHVEKTTTYIRKRFTKKPKGLWCYNQIFTPSLIPMMSVSGLDYILISSYNQMVNGQLMNKPFYMDEMGKTSLVIPFDDRFSRETYDFSRGISSLDKYLADMEKLALGVSGLINTIMINLDQLAPLEGSNAVFPLLYSKLGANSTLPSVFLSQNEVKRSFYLPAGVYGRDISMGKALSINQYILENPVLSRNLGILNLLREAMRECKKNTDERKNMEKLFLKASACGLYIPEQGMSPAIRRVSNRCLCVNLALAQTRQLADRMFSFYQSGEDALLAPRSRDNMSMYPTMEAFWRLGLVNSSLRYASDLQASILNGKMSGRLMKRITECQIVNGKYAVARKNIDLLKQSLFYHDWAVKMEAMLGNDTAISHDPDLGRARRMRFKTEMIYSYDEIDKMMGLLFINNPDNKMALDYFMGQMLLKGDIQGFMRYGSWVQQYGGYMQMPVGYQDAVKCIQNQGNVPGSPYAEYVKRMMSKQKGGEE